MTSITIALKRAVRMLLACPLIIYFHRVLDGTVDSDFLFFLYRVTSSHISYHDAETRNNPTSHFHN